MTLRQFLDFVYSNDVPLDSIITCSPGGGILSNVTPTINGFLILDATPATPDEIRSVVVS